MFDHWISFLVLFVVMLIIVYLVVWSVIALVDHKIGDIRIQMPKIEINDNSSKNNKCDGNTTTGNKEYFDGKDSSNDVNKEFQELDDKIKRGENLADSYDVTSNDKTSLPKTDLLSKTVIGCSQDSDCNVVNGDGKNICKRDGKCYCLSGSGTFCQYGPTNYADPKDMTPEELEVFKNKYRNNFTLQDYKNWLMLYKGDPQHLRYNHRENLKILLRGGQLTDRDLPTIRIKPPMQAADYFQKMYEGGKVSVHFPEESATGAMLGYNYNKFSDFVAPEETENAKVTGIVDMYNQPTKDDAFALNAYLIPDVTVGAERELVGQQYQNSVKRFHNLADYRKFAGQPTAMSLVTFESDDQNVLTNY
jgi:hypothetical protein